jgi:hypothetical protein
VFRRLEGPDFNDCLTLLIESDDSTRKLVLRYAQEKTTSSATTALEAVHRRWSAYGVDRAIKEVAGTGTPGVEVERVLHACEEIRTPKRIEGK